MEPDGRGSDYSYRPGPRLERSLDGLPGHSYHSVSLVHPLLPANRCSPAMFESVKARLDQLLRDRTRSDPRAYMALLREALVEAKVGVAAVRSALAATE